MECRHAFTMCRLCLSESECFIDIFQVNEWFGYVAAEVIRDLLQFQVSEMDGYPHVVCSICLGKLMDFKQFKEQCQNSRDTYNNVFGSDESHAEHPADIVPSEFLKTELEEGTDDADATTQEDLDPANSEEEETITDDIPPQMEIRPVKLEPEDPLDTQEEAQQEIRKCSAAFTSLGYLEPYQRRTHCESYGPYVNTKNSVDDGGKPLLKRRRKIAVDVNPGKNDKSSGSAKVKVGKIDIKVRKDMKYPSERIYMLPVEKSVVKRVELSVEELKSEGMKRREEENSVDASVDATLGNEETLKSKTEKGEKETGSERERGEEAPLGGVNERDGKTERFRCNDCGKNFEKKEALIRHLGVHGYEVNGESSSEKREFQANESKRIITSKKGLKRKRSVKVKRDKGTRKYVCDFCGKGFNRIGNLKIHFRVHSGEKPFACTICGKRFSDKSNLGRHTLTHTGEKRFICEVCGKPFTHKSYLIKHRRVHTGEKPYKCEICGKPFAHRSGLMRHKQAHSGEKPYPCNICNKCFSDRSSLRNHLRIHSQ